MATPITLNTLVESALDAVPGLAYANGSTRADAAAEIVERSQIKFLGNVFSGADYWQVDKHLCSIKSARCDCHDTVAPIANGGRLCAHRLAAMFVVKLQKAATERLTALLTDAPDGEIVIRADVRYMDDGRQYTLNGHRYPGHRWEVYPRAECYPFTEKLFMHTLRQKGWGLSQLPVRQGGYTYNYFLARGVDLGYSFHDKAANDVDREAQINRLRQVEVMLEMESEMEIA